MIHTQTVIYANKNVMRQTKVWQRFQFKPKKKLYRPLSVMKFFVAVLFSLWGNCFCTWKMNAIIKLCVICSYHSCKPLYLNKVVAGHTHSETRFMFHFMDWPQKFNCNIKLSTYYVCIWRYTVCMYFKWKPPKHCSHIGMNNYLYAYKHAPASQPANQPIVRYRHYQKLL